MNEFKIRLREAMEMRKMSQIELVKQTGISKSIINEYLSGRYMPKTSNLVKLSRALEVNEYYLMGVNEEPADSPASASQLSVWDEKYNKKGGLSEEIKLTEMIEAKYSKRSVPLLEAFSQLNTKGQQKAVENVQDLLDVPKYRKEDKK